LSHRSKPNLAEILAVMRHLQDVVALKGNPPQQRQVLIDGLNKLVGTSQAFLFMCDGWRQDGNPRFIHQTLTTERDPTFLRYTADFGVRLPITADPYCLRSLASPAVSQIWTAKQVLADTRTMLAYTDFMDIIRGGRVSDGLVSMHRQAGAGDRILGLGMHQFGDGRPLTPRQITLVSFATREIQRLIDVGHLTLSPVPEVKLSKRLQQILDRLLSGQTPKQISRELHLSVYTVREHVQRLYRHLGVNGRDELMARFVRGFN